MMVVHVFFTYFVLVFFAFLGGAPLGLTADTGMYISWDDFKVFDLSKGLIGEYFKINRIIVVDKIGRGHSLTVQGAVDMVPDYNTERVKIFIYPGIYREKVVIPCTKPYISLIGDENQSMNTVITWSDKASDRNKEGEELGTYRTATVAVEADYFCATGITFENTVVALPGMVGMQAVALRVAGDRAMLYKVRVVGDQDTLLDEGGSHYFLKSYIQGSVDFIFGKSRSLYEDCVIVSTAQGFGAIAAHHRDRYDEDLGFSFLRCEINGTGKIYLGRAWGNYSRIIYSYCNFADIIDPSGWSDWHNPFRQRTAVFAEYHCEGPGANRTGRVPWMKSLSDEEVKPFMDKTFIHGDQWLRL